jgi:hypothetical protein
VEIQRLVLGCRRDGFRAEGVKMRLISRGYRQRAALNLDETLGLEMRPQGGLDGVAAEKNRTPVGMAVRRPPRC